jgi:negative regulator of flagellin synthesis FlgM
MQINGLSNVHPAQPINAPHASRVDRTEPHGGFVAGSDEVHISPEANLVARVHDLPEMRQERIDQIRAQIASGTYETEAKLGVALDRLLDEIG